MTDVFLEYNDITKENMGFLNTGRIKLSDQQVVYKDSKTGKLDPQIQAADIKKVQWVRLGNKPGIKLSLNNGDFYRFGGFQETEFEKIKNFAKKNWKMDITQVEHSIKGWNYGRCDFEDQSMLFEVDDKPCFEIPLTNVNSCTAAKNEAVLEFLQNDDSSVALMEMRFHIPQDPDADEDADPVEEFRKAVMQFAGIESETDQPVAILSQILCTTPRGRYDIKVYPNHLSLHGKTYDYKIPIKTIMRLFLLPHKDGRHMYFVISLNPPLRQGQTRYHFLVLEFSKDEEIDLELGFTEEQLNEQYKGRLEREMSGPVYEVVSKIFRVLMDQKITVPGSFVGHSGTPAIGCAYKQAAGFLYPLEKGFVYVHKPPMYIRFEEISTVNFARSDVSTRSFDFEVELKAGATHVFNSVEKEEYTRLYDFVNNKRLRIRNAKRLDKPMYKEDNFAGSDDEIDPYKEAVKQEARNKVKEEDSDEDSEDEDSDYDVEKDAKKKKEAASSSEGSASEPDEEYDTDAGNESSEGEEGGTKKRKTKTIKEKSSPKKRSKKATKDPLAPKRAQSAYMFWFGECRASIKKEGDSVVDTAKRAGQLWKEMTSADKEKWEKKAEEDKERYKREMKDYQAKGGPPAAATSSKASKSPAKKSGGSKSSPSKMAKSKEFVSESDSSDDDKPLKKKKDKDSDEEEEEEEEESEQESTPDSDESD